jgi:hypothetical protein
LGGPATKLHLCSVCTDFPLLQLSLLPRTAPQLTFARFFSAHTLCCACVHTHLHHLLVNCISATTTPPYPHTSHADDLWLPGVVFFDSSTPSFAHRTFSLIPSSPYAPYTATHDLSLTRRCDDDDNNGHQWTHHGSYAHQVSTESAPCSLLVCGGGRRRHVSEAGFVQGWERQLFYVAVVPWWVLEAQLELGVCTGGGGVGGVVRARWVLIWLIVNSIGALDTSCLGASTPRCGNTAPHGPQPYTPGNNMPRPPGSQPCPPGNNTKRDPSSMRCTCARYFFGSAPRSRFILSTDPRCPFRPHEVNPRAQPPRAQQKKHECQHTPAQQATPKRSNSVSNCKPTSPPPLPSALPSPGPGP